MMNGNACEFKHTFLSTECIHHLHVRNGRQWWCAPLQNMNINSRYDQWPVQKTFINSSTLATKYCGDFRVHVRFACFFNSLDHGVFLCSSNTMFYMRSGLWYQLKSADWWPASYNLVSQWTFNLFVFLYHYSTQIHDNQIWLICCSRASPTV